MVTTIFNVCTTSSNNKQSKLNLTWKVQIINSVVVWKIVYYKKCRFVPNIIIISIKLINIIIIINFTILKWHLTNYIK